MSNELVRYDAMCRAIDAAYAVDEVKAIHDKAAMLQAAARVARNVEAETRAYEIRMRAARKAGSLSKKIEKAKTGPNNFPGSGGKTKTLEAAGISTQQASEWERLSEVQEDQFESALATKSVRDLIGKTPDELASGSKPLFHNDALCLFGILREFEWKGLLQRSPQAFMEHMTTSMLKDVYRLALLVTAWLSTIKDPNDGRINSCDFQSDRAKERREEHQP